VPTGRLERLVRLGVLAGGFAAGGLLEGARRLVGGRDAPVSPFLNVRNAEQLARRLARMRGAAMKLGQLLSMQAADIVPPQFARALDILRDSADTMPEKQVRAVLGREYGRGWQRRFAQIDMQPIAAASIGQVHAARAADGRELALKIQYPGVARSIDGDLAALHGVLRMSHVLPVAVDVRGILAEARAQLHREADYLSEADNLEHYARLVHAAEPLCRVPRVHRDLTTRRILAMERIHARPLDEVIEGPAGQELRDQLGTLLLRLLFREVFEFRFIQTDPNFGNYQVGGDGRLVLLDLGGARAYPDDVPEQVQDMLSAGHRRDRRAVRKAMVAIGFLGKDDDAEMVEAGIDFAFMLVEPLHMPSPYDYGASDLASRAAAALGDLILKKGYNRAPPPDTLFLLRKTTGTYLLLHKMGARVDVRRIAIPYLERRR
jgi:predicted unusual protein kinase regulating ubiquinone biosynthesis (AarF/ABC1/UbiB family)